MARFKLDEDLPATAEVLLRDAGHDVATVAQKEPSGASDLDVHADGTGSRYSSRRNSRGAAQPRSRNDLRSERRAAYESLLAQIMVPTYPKIAATMKSWAATRLSMRPGGLEPGVLGRW